MTQISYLQDDGNALLQAVQWCEELVRGPAMTVIATLAIAGIGLRILGGRIPTRRAFSAILGCFIIFGAPTISLGLMSAASHMPATEYLEPMPVVAAYALPPAPPPAPLPAVNMDPYAGAAVPPPRVPLNDLY